VLNLRWCHFDLIPEAKRLSKKLYFIDFYFVRYNGRMSDFINEAKILIIDDDPNDLQFLGTILQEQNYKLYLANDGMEGLKRAEKIQPDIILLDLVLPGIDGFEILTRLKKSQTTQQIPVVIISGKTSTEDFEKGFSLGAIDFLHKPFSSSELLTRIFTHINSSRGKLELEERVAESKQLLQIVGHDLSNQLFGVKEILEITKDDREELIKSLPLIGASIKNALDIIEILRDFIFIEGKRKEWDLSSVPLKSSIESVVKNLELKYKKKNIAVDLSKIPESLCVLVHQQSFTQSVLSNLISNSIKFSPKGSKIDILAREDKGEVILEIKDYGLGISKEDLPLIFSLKGATNLKKGTEGEVGTGFGMALVKKFVNAYGGEAKVDSIEGKSTTITLILKKGSPKEIRI
jgi:two-component system, sensor histidine kinase and response regulator